MPPVLEQALRMQSGFDRYNGVETGKISQTLAGTSRLNNAPHVLEVVPFNTGQITSPQNGNPQSLLYESHPNDSRVTGPVDIAPTISQRYGTGGNNTPLVQNIDCTPNVYREGSFGDYVEGEFGTLKASGGVFSWSETFEAKATPCAV